MFAAWRFSPKRISGGFLLSLILMLAFAGLAQAAKPIRVSVAAAASPASIQAGQTEQLSATASANQKLSNYNLVFMVTFNGVQVASQTFTGLNFSSHSLTKTWGWAVPSTATAGTYTFTARLTNAQGTSYGSAQTT